MSNLSNFFQSANIEIAMAGYLDVGSEWKYMVQDFLYVRLYYIRSGSARLTLTNGVLELEEGYLYFIPAFSILNGTCDKQMGHYFIHIIPDLFSEHFFKVLSPKHRCKLDVQTADYLFRTVIFQHEVHSLAAEMATDSALKLIFSYFFAGLDTTIAQNNLNRFIKVFNYIDEHIQEKIRIRDLSALVYADDAYFSNLFKKTFGISLQQYILDKRLDRAKSMLATEMTISEIANQLNFFDAASFTNFFKKQVGMTPKDFRLKLFSDRT